jgi:hypothetical protein
MVGTIPSVAFNPAILCTLVYRLLHRDIFEEGDRGDWQCIAGRKMKEASIVAYPI